MEMTIELLAFIISIFSMGVTGASQFASKDKQQVKETYELVTTLDRRLDKIEQSLVAHQSHLNSLDTQLNAKLGYQIEQGKRIDLLEQSLVRHEERLESLHLQIETKLESQVERLNRYLNEGDARNQSKFSSLGTIGLVILQADFLVWLFLHNLV